MRSLKSRICYFFGKASDTHQHPGASRAQRMRLACFIAAGLLALGSCLVLADALGLHMAASASKGLQSITLPVREAANALTALAPAPVPTPTPPFSRVGALRLSPNQPAAWSGV